MPNYSFYVRAINWSEFSLWHISWGLVAGGDNTWIDIHSKTFFSAIVESAISNLELDQWI